MVQVSLSTSTTFEGDLNALVEDQGTALTVRFDLDEPAPAGGLKVYIDSDTVQILNRLDLPGAIANPQFENLDLLATQTNLDNSGLAVQITEGSTFATITLDIFDNDEPDTFLPETFDGLVEATLSLVTADQIAPEDQPAIIGVGDYTIDPDAASSIVLFADTESQLPGAPPPTNDYDEAVSGDISDDPNNPLDLPLEAGTTRLSATTGGGEQEYVTVTVPDGFQLDSLVLESYTPNDVAFIGAQEGAVFTQPLDNSAVLSEFLGYTLFGTSAVGTDILDNIGNGSNGPGFGGQGFEGPLASGDYTFALQQLGAVTDYTLAFNVTEAAVVENTSPVATDDSYTVIIPGVPDVEPPTELTVDAVGGVLANDSDANGDSLTVAIATPPASGSVDLSADGSFTYTPTNGFNSEEPDNFTYTVSDGNGGSDTGSVTITTQVAPTVPTAPVVSFEAIPATISEEGSAEERLLRLEFSVVGEIPEGGLVVLFENLFGITDQMDSEDDRGAFTNLGLVPPFDVVNNIIGVRLDANEAFMELPIINDLVEETTTFAFALLEGDGYVVDPNQNATLFTITDDNGGPGVGPTIALSVSDTNLTEGDSLTVNFDVVDGEIPEGGVDVLVQSTVAAALGQFELSDLSALQLSGVSNLRPGDDRGLSFIATLTEANASITLDVFDDIVAEDPLEIPFTLANGELYEVDPNAASVTLTIADEPQPVGPTVSISLDNPDAVEGETITLTFDVAGEIPPEGVQVLVNDTASAGSGVRSLTEFDITGVQLNGIDTFPIPAEGDSGFFVTLTQETSSITLPVLDDGADEDEAAEVFTFDLIDGEAYEVDPSASNVTLNITDVADATDLPVVSITTTTPEVTEELEPNLEFVFTVEGEIPDDGQGLVVTVAGDGIAKFFAPRFLAESTSLAFDPLDGVVPISFTGTEVTFGLLVPEVTFTGGLFDDLVEEERDVLNFEILPGDGYTIGQGTVSIGVEDGPSATPGEGPTVNLSVTDSDLFEGDEFTVNISVDESTGAIPDGGLELFIDSGPTDVGEFNIFGDDGIDPDTDLVGLAGFPEQGDRNGGFFVTVVEPEASITLSVFEDGPGEGEEVLNFELADGEIYEVANSTVDLTINDTPPGTPIVSITTTTPVVSEDENPTLQFTLTVDGPIPDGGVPITFAGDFADLFTPRLLDGNVPTVIDPPDGVLPVANRDPEFDVNVTAPVVVLEATLFNDIVEEEDLTLDIEILGRDGTVIGADAGVVSITIVDGDSATPGEGPTVSLSVTDSDLVEGDELTVNISVDESTGAIPEGGLELFIDGGPTDLGEFNIFGEDGIDPETDLVGIAGFPEQGDDLGGFFVTVVEPEASITLSVFDDGPNEGLEELNFTLADGEIYEVDPDAQNVTLTINDGGEDAEYAVVDGVTSVYLDFALLEEVAGITLVGADSDAMPEERPFFLPPFQVGFEITEETDFSFAPVGFVPVGGSIEHDGTITLGVGGAEVTVGEFSIGFDPARASDVASGFFVADTLDDALGLEVLFDLGIPATAAVSGIDGDDLNLGDLDLLLAPELATALGNADLAGADVGDARVDALVEVVPTLPVVSFDIVEDVVAEDSDNPSFTFKIITEGEIPEEGIVTVWGGDFLNQPPVLDNNIPVPFLPDGSIEFGVPVFDDDGNLTGFTVTIFDNEITANPFIFDDIIEEEPLDLVYTLLPGEGYTVGQADATVTIIDGPSVIPGSGPIVSLSVSETNLEEGDEFTVFFDVVGEIPEDGLEIFVGSGPTDVGEFNIFGENGIDPATDLVGLAGFPEQGGAGGGFFATLVENQASITLSVFEDGPNEGTETLTFELADGELYEIGSDAGVVNLTISDVGTVGTDEADTLVGDDTDEAIGGLAGDDTVAGGLGDDLILGGEGDDVLRGDLNSRATQDGEPGGDDIIFGGEGNDRIGGKAGNDILSGDEGDDQIWGDDGDDILMGVTGNDILTGDNGSSGSGSDIFVFGNGDGTDTITDFEVGIDTIGLVEGELVFTDLTLTQDGVNTLLGVAASGETLAILNNVQASALDASSFVVVPDVSNPDEALALV